MRGLLVILIDESSAMQAVVSQASKKSLSESVATAVNSLLGRLAQGKTSIWPWSDIAPRATARPTWLAAGAALWADANGSRPRAWLPRQ